MEAALIEGLTSADCVPWRGEDVPTGAAVEAAVRCLPGGGAASELTLVAYSDGDALRDAWSARVDDARPRLDQVSTACDESTVGVRRWGFGRLACTVEDGSAIVSWTDTRSHVLGMARGVGPEIGELYAWWQADARRMGRIASDGPATSGSRPRRPLIRVPGAPDDVVCTSLAEPIVDAHGRPWQVERVRFFDRPGYERVAIALQRTGRIRPGRGAEVTVEQMPVSAVTSEVPGAARPKRGRTALVVRMQGVTRAPALRAYRPRGLDLVRELSIVRGDRSRTAILSLAGDGCYEMRIPVFGPSATGDEDRAEIFIDIVR